MAVKSRRGKKKKIRVTAGNIRNSGSTWRDTEEKEKGKVRVTAGNIRNSGSSQRQAGGRPKKEPESGGAWVTAGSMHRRGKHMAHGKRRQASRGGKDRAGEREKRTAKRGHFVYSPLEVMTSWREKEKTTKDAEQPSQKSWSAAAQLPAAPGSYLPGAARDVWTDFADAGKEIDDDIRAREWVDYTNRLGKPGVSAEEQSARNAVNEGYGQMIGGMQAAADQKFNEESGDLYALGQDVSMLYHPVPGEAGEELTKQAIAAADEYNARTAGNQARQEAVNEVRREKTAVNDWFKLQDVAREISAAQESPDYFAAAVEAGKQSGNNWYEQAYSDGNFLNRFAQNGTPEQKQAVAMIGGNDLLAGAFLRKEAFLTEDERDVLNYYCGIGAPEEAEAFYQLIERELDKRKSDFLTENRAAYMAEHDSGLMRAYEAGNNIASGIAGNFGMLGETLGQKLQNAATGEYRDVNLYGVAGTLKRNEEITRDALVEGLSPEMTALVDMGLGVGKFLPALAAGPAAPIVAGVESAGEAAYDAGKRGGSVEQMLQAGAVSGAVDAALSALPARELYKLAGSTPKSITGFARGVLKQAGLSATEAGVSSYMRTLADLYVMGEDSRYEQYRRGLTAKGMSGEEATREANMEFFLREPVMEMVQGAGGGALTAGAAQALEIMTHRFSNWRLKVAQERIWEKFVQETNGLTARERGLFGGEDLQQSPDYDYAPDMEYVTPEGVRFSGGEVEIPQNNIVFSKASFPDGKQYTKIDVGQELFEGVTENDYPKIAKKIIMEKFGGKVIGEGDKRAFVNSNTAGEYAYPAKKTSTDVRNAKMRAATELDTLLETAEFLEHRKYDNDNPDPRHPQKNTEWDIYKVIFEVGGRYFEGELNVKYNRHNNGRIGKLFYDITQIKDITDDMSSLYGD